jgi:tryptophan synthase alpha chain
MSRIKNQFEHLAVAGEKGLIAYVMAGDPDLIETEKIVLEIAKAGADAIELGVPFSDPVADGPTIQRAAERALRHGVTLSSVMELVATLRKQTKIPILLMTYLNPVHALGIETFFKEARRVQVDGVIIPDLPLEEAREALILSRRHRVDLIFLVAPTTPFLRIEKIAKAATGFLYYVSLTGTTGAAISEMGSVTERIRQIKMVTRTPVAAGFGISTPEEARAISRLADGVIVGSQLVRIIATASEDPAYLARLSKQVSAFKEAIRSPV